MRSASAYGGIYQRAVGTQVPSHAPNWLILFCVA